MNTISMLNSNASITISINWSEDLEPLGHPSKQPYSGREEGTCEWVTWRVESHLERLYARCDALLKRCDELESVLLKISQQPKP